LEVLHSIGDLLVQVFILIFGKIVGPWLARHLLFGIPGITFILVAFFSGYKRKISPGNVAGTSVIQAVLAGIFIVLLWLLPPSRALLGSPPSAFLFLYIVESQAWMVFTKTLAMLNMSKELGREDVLSGLGVTLIAIPLTGDVLHGSLGSYPF